MTTVAAPEPPAPFRRIPWIEGRGGTWLLAIATTVAAVFCYAYTKGGWNPFTGWPVVAERVDGRGYDVVNRHRLLATIGIGILWALYFAWLFRGRWTPRSFPQLLLVASPFLAISLISFPLKNSDLYLYLHYGIMAARGENPFVVPAKAVATLMTPHLHWGQTSTYGPASVAAFAAFAPIAERNVVAGVYSFKLAATAIHVLNAWLVWRTLRRERGGQRLAAAYLLNPALMIFHVANAHVDVLLATSVIATVTALRSGRYTAAMFAAYVGVIIKTLPIIWLPLIGMRILAERRWRSAALVTVAGAAAVAALTATALPGIQAWGSLLNPGVGGRTSRSIHHIVNLTLSLGGAMPRDSWGVTTAAVSMLTWPVFLAVWARELVRNLRPRPRDGESIAAGLGWVALALLLINTPWVMPWYPTAVLPIAFLCPRRPALLLTAITFAASASLIVGPGAGRNWASLASALVTIGPAIAVAVTLWIRPRWATIAAESCGVTPCRA